MKSIWIVSYYILILLLYLLLIIIIVYFQQLGGKYVIVEVDEIEFGTKRKGGVGRDVTDTKKMVLAIVDRTTGIWVAKLTHNFKRDAHALGLIMHKYIYNY